MQHDLFHVYTVDEHILMVIRNLRRFTEPQHAHEYPLCSRLIADFELPRSALPRRAVPRHREGSRRRSLDARRASTRGVSARSTALARGGRRARRVARRASPDRCRRPRRSRTSPIPSVVGAFAAQVARRAPPGRALPADRRRHPRHEPEGVERLEGQAARGPVPRDARARSRRRSGHTLADSHSRAPARSAASCCGSMRCRTAPSRHAVARARQRSTSSVRPPTRSRGTRGTAALARCDGTAPVVQRAQLARRGAGLQVARLPARPEGRCSPASAASSGARDCRFVEAKVHTTRHGYALDTFALHDPANPDASYRDDDPVRRIRARAGADRTAGPLEPPVMGRIRAPAASLSR